MSPDKAELLERIQAFGIDGTEPVALPFASRLARENGWSRAYAERVIREYKRYMFLAASSNVPVCPSEDVDAAWHLHLTYTQNYWKRFCGEVLGTPVHHDPTRGDSAEAVKHFQMYERTLAIYRSAFGHEPPTDIWPSAADRFGHNKKMRLVNTTRNWVIPKAPIKQVVGVTAAGLAIAMVVPGCVGGELNPFNLEGAEFLAFLIPMMIAAMCVGRVIRSRMRTPDPRAGDENVLLNWEQVAFLSGGYPRLITAAIARLVKSGAAQVSLDRAKLIPGNVPSTGSLSTVEAVIVMALPIEQSPADLKRLGVAVESEFSSQVAILKEEGFLLSDSQQVKSWFASLMPIVLVLLLLAVPRLIMGLENHKPVIYLLVTMFFGAGIGLAVSGVGLTRLSRRGENVLIWLKAQNAALKGTNHIGADSVGLGVALFGTAILGAAGMVALESWFPRKSHDSSTGCGSGCGTGGDGGSGCGGGGDGGGGCGGCGGGD